MKAIKVFAIMLLCCAGCMPGFRYAPSEAQKQGAELTHGLAVKIRAEGTQAKSPASLKMVQGTQVALTYIGRPKAPPDPQQFDTIVSVAEQDAVKRPDPWEIADSALELGIGVSALLGGVYGTRAVRFLKDARDKSKALKEIVEGNELLKEAPAMTRDAFRTAHKGQSPKTKQIVMQIKTK